MELDTKMEFFVSTKARKTEVMAERICSGVRFSGSVHEASSLSSRFLLAILGGQTVIKGSWVVEDEGGIIGGRVGIGTFPERADCNCVATEVISVSA